MAGDKYNEQRLKLSYKSIDENYCYGNFGDFKIIIMNKNGYVNVTNLCIQSNKNDLSTKIYKEYKKLKIAKLYLNEISETENINKEDLTIRVKLGNQLIIGIYVHPLLIIHIAQWLCVKFALQVSKIIINFYVKEKEQKSIIVDKNNKIDKMTHKINKILAENKKQTKKINKLLCQNENLFDQNENITDKLEVISNDRVVNSKDSDNQHKLIIIKNNSKKEEYEYTVLRVLNKSYNIRLMNHKCRYPKMKILTIIKYSPNSINLWIRIKETLTSKPKKTSVCNNKFNLAKRYSEKELINDINRIHNERLNVTDL